MHSWKHYKKLHQKKYRDEWNLFIVEGTRFCLEALQSNWKTEAAFINDNFLYHPSYQIFNNFFHQKQIVPQSLAEKEFKQLSMIQNPQGVLLVMQIPERYFDVKIISTKMNVVLLLESIRDPGNLGTIIRTADWFGIKLIIASSDCAEFFNPKCLRASMGSIFRVKCFEVNELNVWIQKLKNDDFFIVGTSPHTGQPLFRLKVRYPLAICLGGEANGISDNIQKSVDITTYIPKYGEGESLNVAVSAGILMNYFRNPLK